jgi:tRNA threonylcarbamoyladenosine biosynthesis protein TsaE
VPREVTTRSVDETLALGERLGRQLQSGDFVGLQGELGAGKTVFARGVAAGTGADVSEVSSPTYAIVQSYPGRVTLHHADLYRLSTQRDLEGTGFFDLRDEGGACLVEWIDRIRAAAPPDWLELRLGALDEAKRAIEIIPHGGRSEALLRAWLGA